VRRPRVVTHGEPWVIRRHDATVAEGGGTVAELEAEGGGTVAELEAAAAFLPRTPQITTMLLSL